MSESAHKLLYFCKYCNEPWEKSEEHDAYYCDGCNIWVESKCSDEHCEYCEKREDRPDMSRPKTIRDRRASVCAAIRN